VNNEEASMCRALMIVAMTLLVAAAAVAAEESTVDGTCLTCHKEQSPGLYQQWYNSEHSRHDVTCLSCHQAEKGEVDAFDHYGASIATLVTPKDCAVCHDKRRTRSAAPTTPRPARSWTRLTPTWLT
jgi:hypothetical protein